MNLIFLYEHNELISLKEKDREEEVKRKQNDSQKDFAGKEATQRLDDQIESIYQMLSTISTCSTCTTKFKRIKRGTK